MFSTLLKGFLIILMIAILGATALHWRFGRQLKRLEASVEHRAPVTARDDLPAQVVALAERQGASRTALAPAARLTQTGVMWQSPEAPGMSFTARQVIAADDPSFVWTASFVPLGVVTVADYFIAGMGGLDGRLLGIYPVARSIGGDDIAKGELMRYLAELPWNPDAMLANRMLYWLVIDDRTLKVSAGDGAARAEVTLRLNAEGFVETVEARDRPRVQGDTLTPQSWRGYFSDYRKMGGRTVPTHAEVAWVVEGEDFVYWRATIDSWTPIGTKSASEPMPVSK